ncbi:MAG: hypothetical protein R3C40_07405 [Parvularculaceae bacterium]
MSSFLKAFRNGEDVVRGEVINDGFIIPGDALAIRRRYRVIAENGDTMIIKNVDIMLASSTALPSSR